MITITGNWLDFLVIPVFGMMLYVIAFHHGKRKGREWAEDQFCDKYLIEDEPIK